MADSTSARPKWIPSYAQRTGAGGKEHVSKWSTELFLDDEAFVDAETFVDRLRAVDYAPPLGGPYLAASAAEISDDSSSGAQAACLRLFKVLSGGKPKLSKAKMSVRLKQLAGGEEGMMWASFLSAMTASAAAATTTTTTN